MSFFADVLTLVLAPAIASAGSLPHLRIVTELQLALQQLIALLLEWRQLLDSYHLKRIDDAPLAFPVENMRLAFGHLLREGLLRQSLATHLAVANGTCLRRDTRMCIVHQHFIRLLVVLDLLRPSLRGAGVRIGTGELTFVVSAVEANLALLKIVIIISLYLLVRSVKQLLLIRLSDAVCHMLSRSVDDRAVEGVPLTGLRHVRI